MPQTIYLVNEWQNAKLDHNKLYKRNQLVNNHYNKNKSPSYIRNLFVEYTACMMPYPIDSFPRQFQGEEIIKDKVDKKEMYIGDYAIMIASKMKLYSEMDDIDEVIKRMAKMHNNVVNKQNQVEKYGHGSSTNSVVHWELVWLHALVQFLRYKYTLFATFSSKEYPEDITRVDIFSEVDKVHQDENQNQFNL